MSNPNAGYGWRPDKPDHRDLLFEPPTTLAPQDLPLSVDLRAGFPAPYDQGDLGSCTANAIAAALEYDQRKQKEKSATPSRLFIYFNERTMEGTVSSDAGAEIRDGVKSVNQLGAPPETLWKYVASKFAVKPPATAYAAATKHQSVKYQRLSNTHLLDLKRTLAGGFPFVFGFTVYEAFEGAKVAKTGIVPMPAPKEKSVGGHAVIAVGYDATKELFLVRNSWGSDWGVGGYFWMPFEYVISPDLADDFWVIQQVE